MAQTVPEEDSDLEDDSENDDSGFRYKPDKDEEPKELKPEDKFQEFLRVLLKKKEVWFTKELLVRHLYFCKKFIL